MFFTVGLHITVISPGQRQQRQSFAHGELSSGWLNGGPNGFHNGWLIQSHPSFMFKTPIVWPQKTWTNVY